MLKVIRAYLIAIASRSKNYININNGSDSVKLEDLFSNLIDESKRLKSKDSDAIALNINQRKQKSINLIIKIRYKNTLKIRVK